MILKSPLEGQPELSRKILLLLFDWHHAKSLYKISKIPRHRFWEKCGRTNEGELLGPIPSFVGGPKSPLGTSAGGGQVLKSQTLCVLKYIWIKSSALLLVLKNHDFSTLVLKVFRQKSERGLLKFRVLSLYMQIILIFLDIMRKFKKSLTSNLENWWNLEK